MSRHEDYDEKKLKSLVKEIQQRYVVLSLETFNRANSENPERFPVFKTFQRKLGGIKDIKRDAGNY
jgi:hypothetical protein